MHMHFEFEMHVPTKKKLYICTLIFEMHSQEKKEIIYMYFNI